MFESLRNENGVQWDQLMAVKDSTDRSDEITGASEAGYQEIERQPWKNDRSL